MFRTLCLSLIGLAVCFILVGCGEGYASASIFGEDFVRTTRANTVRIHNNIEGVSLANLTVGGQVRLVEYQIDGTRGCLSDLRTGQEIAVGLGYAGQCGGQVELKVDIIDTLSRKPIGIARHYASVYNGTWGFYGRYCGQAPNMWVVVPEDVVSIKPLDLSRQNRP